MPDFVEPIAGTPLANRMQPLTGQPTGATNGVLPTLAQSKQAQLTVPGAITYGLAGIGLGALDTMGQSLHIIGEGDMQKTLGSVAPGSLGDFYKTNQEGLRVAGELVTLPIPGGIALKGLKTAQWALDAGKLGTFLKNSTTAQTIFGSAARLAASEDRMTQLATEIKETSGTIAGRTFNAPAVQAARKSFYGQRVLDTAREAAAFELSYRALYNKSELMEPSEYNLSDELLWSGASIALGGGIGFVQARYAARQLIKAAPELSAGASQSLRELKTFAAQGVKEVYDAPGDRGASLSYFARLKELTTAALKDTSSPVLTTNLKQDMASIDNVLKVGLTGMAKDTHPFVSSFNLSEPQANLLVGALAKNPLLMLFSPKIGEITESSGTFYQGITDELDRLKQFGLRLDSRIAKTFTKSRKPETAAAKLETRAAAQERQGTLKEEYDALDKFSTQSHFVVESWGDVAPYRVRADNWLDTHDFGSINRTTFKQAEADINTAGATVNVQHSQLNVGELKLDDRFILDVPGTTKNLSHDGWSQSYAMGSKLINDWKPVPNQVFPLTEQTPRFQMEAIMALGQQNKQAAGLIKLGGKFQSMKDVEFDVINKKYQEYLSRLPSTQRKTRGARDILSRTVTSPEELIDDLNLPRSPGVQQNPILDLFAQAKTQGAKSLEEIFPRSKSTLAPNADHPMDLLQSQLRGIAGITDNNVTMPTAGSMFLQKNIKPILVVSDAVPQMGVADALIHARVQQTQQNVLQRLSQINTPIVQGTLQHLVNSGAMSEAKDVTSLHDAVASGRGVVVPQDRIDEQYPALKALALMSQDSDNFILGGVRKIFDTKLTGLYAEIRNNKNYNSLVDASRIEHSYRHGWDIAKVEYMDDGKSAQFVLKGDSPQNQALMQRHFQQDLPQGVVNYMPDMSITARKNGVIPLRTSKLAADFMDEISNLSRGAGMEDNALRTARGRGPVQLRDWHLPAPELAMKDAWFVRNDAGDVVDLYHAGTDAQNKARALAAADKLSANGAQHVAYSYESTRLQHQWSDDPLHFINYADQWLKTGVGISGGAARAEIDRTSNTIDKMVNTLAQQYVNVGTRARAALFEPQIRFAREASLYAGKGSGLATGTNNIFDRYLSHVYSRSTQSGQGFLAQGYKLFENAYDAAATYLYALKSEATAGDSAGVAAARGLKRLVQTNVDDTTFRQYKQLDAWSPFQTTQDWLESTHPEIPTSFLKQHSVALSKASATMSLRFMDLGTPLLNYSSLMTNVYPIIRAMRPQAGQSMEAWLADNAAYGSKLSSKNVMTFSPMRALVSSISNFWTGKHLPAIEKAASEGMFDPEWLRLERALVVPPRKGDKGAFGKFVDAASTIADRSEISSRRIAWGIGFDLGKNLFKLDDDRNATIFATHFVNQMIGNYNPRNKPGMYQGAVGMPLGSMMTFMFNFYKRSFGYLERGDWSTLAAQYATQASVFGAQSVPGWNLFNHYMFSDYDGSDNLTTRLDRKLSPGVAELVLHGSLSGIPRIFGVDAPALYPRGSVDMTSLPSTPADFARAPPAIFLKSLWDGASATLGNIASGFNLQQQEEIFANYSTNRAFKNTMDFAAGAKVDRAGQMVEANTRDMASIAAALVGTVPASARQAQDAYNAQQVVEVNQANARSMLNDHMRAVMRSGNFGMEDMQKMMYQYVKSGGNPAYFGSWIRNNIEMSFFPKGERKLLELSRGSDWVEFQNMMAAMQFEPGSEAPQQ